MKLGFCRILHKTLMLFCLPVLLAGCGMTFPMSSLLKKEDVEKTGSIISSSLSDDMSTDKKLTNMEEEDWRRAKNALALALDPQGPGTIVKWDNPDSGRKGSFTPIGTLFVENNEICRLFTAEIFEKDSASSPYEGKACRPSGEEWNIKRFEKKKTEASDTAADDISSNTGKAPSPIALSP